MFSWSTWTGWMRNVRDRMSGRYQQMKQEVNQPIRPYAKYRWIILCFITMIVLAAITAFIHHASRCVPPPDRHIPQISGKLNCSASALAKSAKTPKDVNQVRPADIAYVAALGDSITTGTLAYDRPDEYSCMTQDHPGNSFAMGGDGNLETHLTLPNILRRLNPALIGFSTGVGKDVKNLGLNVAYPGKWADDLPRQARELVERFKKYPTGSVQSDWKLINFFIGTNDITGICKHNNGTTKEAYKNYIQDAISIIQTNIPRSIISLIGMWNLDFQWRAGKIMFDTSYANCSTADFEAIAQQRVVEYREALIELAANAALHSINQTVVVQRVFDDLATPLKRSDGSHEAQFYATDFFHLSKYGNRRCILRCSGRECDRTWKGAIVVISSLVAKQLWKQLLQPVGSKATNNEEMADNGPVLACPDEACPYIRTSGNSRNCEVTDYLEMQ